MQEVARAVEDVVLLVDLEQLEGRTRPPALLLGLAIVNILTKMIHRRCWAGTAWVERGRVHEQVERAEGDLLLRCYSGSHAHK